MFDLQNKYITPEHEVSHNHIMNVAKFALYMQNAHCTYDQVLTQTRALEFDFEEPALVCEHNQVGIEDTTESKDEQLLIETQAIEFDFEPPAIVYEYQQVGAEETTESEYEQLLIDRQANQLAITESAGETFDRELAELNREDTEPSNSSAPVAVSSKAKPAARNAKTQPKPRGKAEAKQQSGPMHGPTIVQQASVFDRNDFRARNASKAARSHLSEAEHLERRKAEIAEALKNNDTTRANIHKFISKNYNNMPHLPISQIVIDECHNTAGEACSQQPMLSELQPSQPEHAAVNDTDSSGQLPGQCDQIVAELCDAVAEPTSDECNDEQCEAGQTECMQVDNAAEIHKFTNYNHCVGNEHEHTQPIHSEDYADTNSALLKPKASKMCTRTFRCRHA